LKPGYLLEIGNILLEIGRHKGYLTRGDWIETTFGGIYVSRGYEFRVCKRGKNKDSFVKKQYFFSNYWPDAWPSAFFPQPFGP
jgi:hypothetical protein